MRLKTNDLVEGTPPSGYSKDVDLFTDMIELDNLPDSTT